MAGRADGVYIIISYSYLYSLVEFQFEFDVLSAGTASAERMHL